MNRVRYRTYAVRETPRSVAHALGYADRKPKQLVVEALVITAA